MKSLFLMFVLLPCLLAAQNTPTPQMIRAAISGQAKSYNIAPEQVLKVEEQTIGEKKIPIRIYKPGDKKGHPVIFNIHGGALVAGDLDTHDNISRKLANATNSIVISVDYRKAPENPFPASLDDVYETYQWITKNAASLGNGKLFLVSDSGGSLLAAALQVKLQQNKVASQIKGAVYINPAVDLRNPGGGMYGLVTSWYLSGADTNNELVSPILAKSVSGFAPALIVVSEKDELLSHGTALHAKLKEGKILSEIVTRANQDHLGGLWSAAHPESKIAFDAAVAFLRKMQ